MNALLREDVGSLERALTHMQDKYVAVGKRLANWHIHNVGEWWMIWTEILGAAFDNEASILVPALVPARPKTAPGAPAPAVDAETGRRQTLGDSLALERQQIELLVGRITTQLLVRFNSPCALVGAGCDAATERVHPC